MAFSSSVRATQAKPAASCAPNSSRHAAVTRASNKPDAPSSLASVASRIAAATASGLILMVGSQPAMSAVLPAAPMEIAQVAYTDPLGKAVGDVSLPPADLPQNVAEDITRGPQRAGQDLRDQASNIGRSLGGGKIQEAVEAVSGKISDVSGSVSSGIQSATDLGSSNAGKFQDAAKAGGSKIQSMTDMADVGDFGGYRDPLGKFFGGLRPPRADLPQNVAEDLTRGPQRVGKDLRRQAASVGRGLGAGKLQEAAEDVSGGATSLLKDVTSGGKAGDIGDAVSSKLASDINTAKGVGKNIQKQASDARPGGIGLSIQQAASSAGAKIQSMTDDM